MNEVFSPSKAAIQIAVIVDASYSMLGIQESSMKSFNDFLATQKETLPNAQISVTLFNTRHWDIYAGSVAGCPNLTVSNYRPDGNTALNDTACAVIDKLKEFNPARAIVMILTDGEENASTLHSKRDVMNRVGFCNERDWGVIYLGAHANAFAEAASYGISAHRSRVFTATAAGMGVRGMCMNTATANYAAGASLDSLLDDPVPVAVVPPQTTNATTP